MGRPTAANKAEVLARLAGNGGNASEAAEHFKISRQSVINYRKEDQERARAEAAARTEIEEAAYKVRLWDGVKEWENLYLIYDGRTIKTARATAPEADLESLAEKHVVNREDLRVRIERRAAMDGAEKGKNWHEEEARRRRVIDAELVRRLPTEEEQAAREDAIRTEEREQLKAATKRRGH